MLVIDEDIHSERCLNCKYLSMCKKGFVVDCEDGTVYAESGVEDIGSATYRAIREQNGDPL